MRVLKKYVYLFIIFLFIIGIIYFIFVKRELYKNSENVIIEEEISIEDEVIESNEKVIVDIKGAIKRPGVYQVDSNLVINDVINMAGGLNKNADTSLINLAKKVNDEMVIIIYTKDEVKRSNIINPIIKVVEKECVCPNIKNDGCLNDKIDDTITNSEKLVNINTSSLEELVTIPGVGESKAKAIIEYREKNKFNSIEDILNVSGIGNSLYEQIKVYITT